MDQYGTYVKGILTVVLFESTPPPPPSIVNSWGFPLVVLANHVGEYLTI
jgi:hypothetical protein